jgi:DtxR family Mn-dependent transcriptional regulator
MVPGYWLAGLGIHVDSFPLFVLNQARMTQSLEDYLEAVSFLADSGAVRVTDIASRLGVSKPSVLVALRSLEERGLLEHERYRGVILTGIGAVRAAEIRDRHEFLTAFLRDVVGVSQEIAEKDACRMEHVLSEETMKRMREIASCSDGRP